MVTCAHILILHIYTITHIYAHYRDDLVHMYNVYISAIFAKFKQNFSFVTSSPIVYLAFSSITAVVILYWGCKMGGF